MQQIRHHLATVLLPHQKLEHCADNDPRLLCPLMMSSSFAPAAADLGIDVMQF